MVFSISPPLHMWASGFKSCTNREFQRENQIQRQQYRISWGFGALSILCVCGYPPESSLSLGLGSDKFLYFQRNRCVVGSRMIK